MLKDKPFTQISGARTDRFIFFHQQATHSQQGAALIGIIVSILVVASIGTAILSMTATSSRIQIGSIDSLNGLFLAESGKNYALQYINQEMATNGDPDTGTIPLLNNKTFTLPDNAGQFHITLSQTHCPGTNCAYTLISTGIPNSTAARELTYQIRPY